MYGREKGIPLLVPKTQPPSLKPSKQKRSDAEVLKLMGYTLGKVLGQGSFATVQYAEYTDPKSKKVFPLAAKVMDLNKTSEAFRTKFFPRELNIMCQLTHINCVTIHSILKETEKFYLFLEFCGGGDMLGFITKYGALREEQSRIWFSETLAGLEYLHNLDIVHRDMKCENIFMTASYKCKIGDYGFARIFKSKDKLSETYCGSILYAPPEVVKGIPYDAKKFDIWAMGCIMYVMICASLAFNQNNGLGKLYEDQTKRNWRLRANVKDYVTNEFKVLIYELLDPNPATRKSASEVRKSPWLSIKIM